MCLQAAGAGRHRLLALRGGYHGDTFGAMSVCDPVDGMHHLFAGGAARAAVRAAPAGRRRRGARRRPRRRAARAASRATAASSRRRSSSRSCRGRAGCGSTRRRACALLRELCDEHGVLLVFDEIATGFGRARDVLRRRARRRRAGRDVRRQGAHGWLPDARGDALHRASVARAIGGPLMHGPTFMGNPLACAVALANLELLASGEWRAQVARDRAGAARRSSRRRRSPGGARRARARGDRGDRARARRRRRARRARRRSSTASGCGRFATSSTRCRRMSRASRTCADRRARWSRLQRRAEAGRWLTRSARWSRSAGGCWMSPASRTWSGGTSRCATRAGGGSGSRPVASASTRSPRRTCCWSAGTASCSRARGPGTASTRSTPRSCARVPRWRASCTCTRRTRSRSPRAAGRCRSFSHAAGFIGAGVRRYADAPGLVDTAEAGVALGARARRRPALLLTGHGVVTVGPSVELAVMTAVMLERACELQLLADGYGGVAAPLGELEAARRTRTRSRTTTCSAPGAISCGARRRERARTACRSREPGPRPRG